MVRLRVTELLHGQAPASLEYSTPNFHPWGPYYEVGQEIAILVEGGQVSDGVMNLCGPWFGPEELRAAAAEHGTPQVESPLLERLLNFVSLIFRLVLGG